MNATVSTWIFKGPLWVRAGELHAPICPSSQAVWRYVNGNFCLLLCEESTLLSGKTTRERENKERGNSVMETKVRGVDGVVMSWLFLQAVVHIDAVPSICLFMFFKSPHSRLFGSLVTPGMLEQDWRALRSLTRWLHRKHKLSSAHRGCKWMITWEKMCFPREE